MLREEARQLLRPSLAYVAICMPSHIWANASGADESVHQIFLGRLTHHIGFGVLVRIHRMPIVESPDAAKPEAQYTISS